MTDMLSGSKIQLKSNFNIADGAAVEINSNKNLSLDLNNKTITVYDVSCFIIYDGATLTIDDLTKTGNYDGGKIYGTNGGSDGGETLISVGRQKNVNGANVNSPGTFILNGGQIDATNTISAWGIGGVGVFYDSEVFVNGGYIHSRSYAISGNNQKQDMNVTITGGEVHSERNLGIYMPGQTYLNIYGGIIRGGILLRMGQVEITGGEIYGFDKTPVNNISASYTWGKPFVTGDALAVAGGTYDSGNKTYKNSCSIKISGNAKIQSTLRAGIAIYRIGTKNEQNIKLDISGDAEIIGAGESVARDTATKSSGVYVSDSGNAIKVYEAVDISSALSQTDNSDRVTVKMTISGGKLKNGDVTLTSAEITTAMSKYLVSE
jgi:hypothetical protein